MNYRRKGLRALGLSFLAVLGLMAITAASAQAVDSWLYLPNAGGGGVALAVPNNTPVTVESHDKDGILLVPAQNLKILCKKVETTGAGVLLSGTLAAGKVAFTECLTFQNNVDQPVCKPVEPITAGGKAHLILHNGKNYVLFEPETGLTGVFTKVEFGGLCSLPKVNEVTGSLVVECGHLSSNVFVGLDCANHQEKQLIQAVADQTLFTVTLGDGKKHVHGLFFGANPATLDGIAVVTLGGALAGKHWGGHI